MTSDINMGELKKVIGEAAHEAAGRINLSKTEEMIADALKEYAKKESGAWHLDRKVPLALMLTLAVQTFGAIWWAAQMDNRVNTLEQIAVKNAGVETRLARIEESQDWIKNLMERIEQKLERVTK